MEENSQSPTENPQMPAAEPVIVPPEASAVPESVPAEPAADAPPAAAPEIVYPPVESAPVAAAEPAPAEAAAPEALVPEAAPAVEAEAVPAIEAAPAEAVAADAVPSAEPAAEVSSHEIKEYIWATGRRKTSVARIRLRPAGTGQIIVNGRPFEQYFTSLQQHLIVKAPLLATESLSKYDVLATASGGGLMGQAGAMCLGIARALKLAEPEFEPKLREGEFLTRDSRRKERKHYGHKGARRSFQWTKR
ncbi:MAG: 30S ribosomal protein S9 [Planctomycetota bacterium]